MKRIKRPASIVLLAVALLLTLTPVAGFQMMASGAAAGLRAGPFKTGDLNWFDIQPPPGKYVYGVKGSLVWQGKHVNIWVLDDAAYHIATKTAHSASCQLNNITPAKAREIADAADGIFERMTDPDTGLGAYAGVSFGIYGDTDKDGKVNFLFYEMLPGRGGQAWYNSVTDLIWMSTSRLSSNLDSIYGTMAHEFQHLLFSMYINPFLPQPSSWINESLSEFATIYYTKPGVEYNIRIGTGAEYNDYGQFGEYIDFLNFTNSGKNYGMGNALSLFMAKKTGTNYARNVYSYFMKNPPETKGRTMADVWGDAVSSLDIGPGGLDSFSKMYWMFMESYASDGGKVFGLNGAVEDTVKLAAGSNSQFNLWSRRNNYSGIYDFPVASGCIVALGGYGSYAPRSDATHEKFFKLAQGTGADTALTIKVSDAAAGNSTKYYVALKRANGNGSDLPNADLYPLAPGEPREVNTNGAEAFLFVATLYRGVKSYVEYSWSKPSPVVVPAAPSAPTYAHITGYAINYNANGGVGAPAAQTQFNSYTLTVSNTKPTRTGYAFQGWAASPTASTAKYQPGDTYSNNADLTLYAVWATVHG
ncbi:MAG: InlB B-repeat-containing protein [Oscillospiraceae bacterium]|jgi:uncharacterized repeat protein (TIGR02543 family)|nr:InlB B-repeat-containing protein [Oscillospiraceae bacterium]